MCRLNMARMAMVAISCLAGFDAARGGTSRKLLHGSQNAYMAGPVKKLLGDGVTSSHRSTNIMRSQSATADVILRAVNSGANMDDNLLAARVGSQTVYANNKALFDHVEFVNKNGKKLLGGRDSFTASNNLRSEEAAADAIQRTVNGGAKLQDGFRAAGVGSQTVFANSLNDQALFDQVEFVNRPGKKLLQSSQGSFFSSNNLRSEQAAAEAIQQAVDAGADLHDSLRSAAVGSKTVFANAQGSSALFNQVEFDSRNGKK